MIYAKKTKRDSYLPNKMDIKMTPQNRQQDSKIELPFTEITVLTWLDLQFL